MIINNVIAVVVVLLSLLHRAQFHLGRQMYHMQRGSRCTEGAIKIQPVWIYWSKR